MSTAEHQAARVARLIGERRCITCAKRLGEHVRRTSCYACRKRERDRSTARRAVGRPCKFDECVNMYTGTGGSAKRYCSGHYQQLRRGDPLAPLTTALEAGEILNYFRHGQTYSPWTEDDREALWGHYAAGGTAQDYADATNRTPQSVRHMISRLRASKDREPEEDRPRCRCGLSSPCHSCIGSVDDFASMRRGSSTGLP